MIDEVAESGGGKVTIQSGVYYLLNVQMKSNVHILIQDGTVLNLCKESPAGATRNSTIMFTMGGCGKREESECVKNASIEALGENIKVDLTTNPADSKRFLQIGNAQNFIVCGLDIYDNLCKFSCITFGVELTDSGNAAACGGIIKDINCYNCAYGYGAIQVQAGINILFKDIYALGGVTLRLESGIPGTRAEDTKPAKTDKIVARNIISEEGNAALMVSPHTADQGTFDARYIKSIGSGFAARIEKGFGKHEGTFSSDSVLKDVYAVYGERAQLKAKHFKYLPAELADKVTEVDSGNPEVENTYIGPSISAVGLIANYDINFDISEVKQAEGFDYQVNGGKLVTLEDARPEN
ncbi:hypothetical protein [Hungatella sp.]